MALLGKSLQTTHSHNGFKSVFSIKSLFFCCSKTENETKTDEEVVVNNQIKDDNAEKVKDKEVKTIINTESETIQVENLSEQTDYHENLQSEQPQQESNLQAIQVENLSEQTDYHENLQSEQPQQESNLQTIQVENLSEQTDYHENLQSEQPQQESNLPKEEKEINEPISENQKFKELNQKDETNKNQNLDDNTYSLTDDIDNISEHELNAAISGSKVERIKSGDLQIKIGLDADKVTLIITILLAHDYARPSSSTTSIREHSAIDVPPVLAYSVHILLVQSKKQRYKTKMRQGPDPLFNETLKITKINQEEIRKWCLRFRLYGSFRKGQVMGQVIGEGFLQLDKLDLDKKMQCDILLMTQDPSIVQSEMNTLIKASYCKCDSVTSLVSIEKNSIFLESGASPELSVGLTFNLSTGWLTVIIKSGTNFPKLKDNKMPDTFIKTIVSVSKGEVTAKTPVIKANNNPSYDEKFGFTVFGFLLDDTTVTIQGYQMLKFKKKFMFGSFTLGSKVGEEERENHWKDLLLAKTNEEVERKHTFDLHI